MNLTDYQDLAKSTAIYSEVDTNLLYPLLGAFGEAGEVLSQVEKSDTTSFMNYLLAALGSSATAAEICKKAYRDNGGKFSEDTRNKLACLLDAISHNFTTASYKLYESDLEAVFVRGNLTPDPELSKEIGDQLWYVAALATGCGLSLDTIAQENADKLASRKARNVLGGSGDNR